MEGSLRKMVFQPLDGFKLVHALVQKESDQVALRDASFFWYLST
jgi:hypothetical protein